MRYFVNSLLTLLGLVATVSVIALVMPTAVTPLQEWESDRIGNRKQCTVLFVGPSYTKRVEPRFFDQESKRLGTNHRACKLARATLAGVELEHELDALLRRRWPKLKLVVVDITLGDTFAFEPDNWFKSRLVNWHTLESLKRLRRYYPLDESWPQQLIDYAPRLLKHAQHFALNMLEVGNGATLLASFSTFRPKAVSPYHPKRTNKQLMAYVNKLAEAKRAHENKPVYGDSEWPLTLRRRIRDRGYEAAFLFSPVFEESKIPRRAVTGKDRLRVMDFSDPIKYPQYYTKAARGVTSHLSKAMAKRYSQHLARAISEFEPGDEGRRKRKSRNSKTRRGSQGNNASNVKRNAKTRPNDKRKGQARTQRAAKARHKASAKHKANSKHKAHGKRGPKASAT